MCVCVGKRSKAHPPIKDFENSGELENIPSYGLSTLTGHLRGCCQRSKNKRQHRYNVTKFVSKVRLN